MSFAGKTDSSGKFQTFSGQSSGDDLVARYLTGVVLHTAGGRNDLKGRLPESLFLSGSESGVKKRHREVSDKPLSNAFSDKMTNKP